MKVCETCGREYLDMYECCPFCAKAERESVELAQPSPPPAEFRRDPRVHLWPIVLALAVVGVVIAGIVVYVMRSATAPIVATDATSGGADATLGETAAYAASQACVSNQRMIEGAANVCYADTNAQPHTVGALVPDYLPSIPQCTEGGSYGLIWIADVPHASCTVHPRD